MIRPVLVYPDRRLKAVATPVRTFGPALGRLADDLADTARHHPRTVGLAATQIGVMWRVIHVDCTGHPRVPEAAGPLCLVNPVVVEREGSEVDREGCLSLPEVTANVRRATRIEVHARDLDGAPRVVRAEGFEARVLLHEIDHLDGVLILDRVASLAGDVFPRRSGRGRSPGRTLVERARTLARIAHAGQRYGADDPYEAHLAATVAVLEEAGVTDPELRAAAWLHDVVEDTPVTVAELVPEYGERVAALVDALTVRDGPPRDRAHEDSWRRIVPVPGAVLVKLADRTANVRAADHRIARYRAQQPRLEAILTGADPGPGGDAPARRLWEMLRAALAAPG